MKGLDSLVLLTELGVDSSERIDEGLAFESSAFESLYCGQHSRKKKKVSYFEYRFYFALDQFVIGAPRMTSQ